ncbi:MAG: hypothetical protein EOO25_21845, partial [Comamonadaceae bacterium]
MRAATTLHTHVRATGLGDGVSHGLSNGDPNASSSRLSMHDKLSSTARRNAVRCTALTLAIAALAQGAQAQDGGAGYASITGPSRTPVAGLAAPLYPLASPDTPVPSQTPSVLGATRSGIDYRVNQAAGRIVVEVERNAIPADGQTPVAVTVKVLGQDGKPVTQPVWATIEHSGGRILLPGAKTDEQGPLGKDADRATAGVQVEIKNGEARFSLLAPITPQDVLLRVTVGGEEASGVVSFVPEMRDMVAAGLVDGIINFNGKTSGLLQRPRHEDAFEREIRAWGREFNDGKANVAAPGADLALEGIFMARAL